jgi:RimJ/RimL family protein N-acetyltransferase
MDMTMQLETDRLIIRRPERSDAEELAAKINDEKIAATTLLIPYPYTTDDAYVWIDGIKTREGDGPARSFCFFDKETGELIGGIGLSGVHRTHKHAEIGYWCAVKFWNRGYTSEAVKCVVDYGFRVLEVNRIYAHCFQRNIASAEVMKKAGMKYEGSARGEFFKNGKFEDTFWYAIIREDWESSREA